MKTKTFILAMLLLTISMGKAQITPSMTVPNPLPNYDGTYDDFGRNHLFYPNDGEIRFANARQDDAKSTVKFYTMNTYPKKLLLSNNNISYLHYKQKTTATGTDSVQRIDLSWSGSTTGAFLARVDTQNFAKLNYFTQWFTSSGRTDVKGGAAIACQSIYPNTDLVYTSNNNGLVMYFIVYPGGNYKNIIMQINGAKANSIVGTNLKIDANWESSTLEQPQMYQYTYIGNVVTPVNVLNGSWVSAGTNKYQCNTTSSFNNSLPLIIQIRQAGVTAVHTPGLDWSTYFGGSQLDLLTKTHTDVNNNLFIAGYSNSSSANFPQGAGVVPVINNSGDGTIVKFNSTGKILWSTFIGGSSSDEIHDFDFKGDTIYCVGKTGSNDMLPVTKSGATNNGTFGGGNWDAFICRFTFQSGTGIIQKDWLTYYGGNGDEELNACKFDAAGNFFVAGEGSSSNMTPTGAIGTYTQNFNAAQLLPAGNPLSTDAIIAKFNTASLQKWFTFYGTDALGTNAHTNAGDYFYGIAISGTDLYACGKAGGTNLPSSLNNKSNAGNFDGILVHFSTFGSLATNSAKYTNGNISNYAVKSLWNEVYTVGQAISTMTTVNSGQYYYNASSSGTTDACFSVHDQGVGVTLHNTFLGGGADDAAYDIQFTSNNLFYIAGFTNSSNFPTNNLSPTYSSAAAGVNDNFITCFQKGNTNMLYGSYLGSNFSESSQYPLYFNAQQPLAITSIAVDNQNALYLLGWSNSYNMFPLDEWTGTPVYFQSTLSGFDDATVTRFNTIATNSIVGIQDFENTQFVFGLYPNPTASNISITNKELSNNDLHYAVYDIGGQKLKEGTLKASEMKTVDVSQLSQGVYIINVSNGTKTYSNKFVKVTN